MNKTNRPEYLSTFLRKTQAMGYSVTSHFIDEEETFFIPHDYGTYHVVPSSVYNPRLLLQHLLRELQEQLIDSEQRTLKKTAL